MLVFIFVTVIILGTLFIRVTITRPLSEVSDGLKTIAAGNFSRQVKLRFGGEVGELIASFNQLGRQLKLYEEKNIEQQIISRSSHSYLHLTPTI